MKETAIREKKVSLREKLSFFLYPPKCAACGTVGYYGLCPECAASLEDAFQPKKFIAAEGNGFADAMFCLFTYQNPVVKTLLYQWKQRNYRDFPDIFRPYVCRFIKKKLLPEKIHKIAYLPRRPYTRYKMGFDQAEKITLLFSRALDFPAENLLRRRGYVKIQHKQKYAQREKNVHNTFRSTAEFAGETILLIDDIVTTGATAREAARMLKKSGAMKVYILSLAH